MRQAGIIAAAGIVALTGHVERLAEDHENARLLAEGLAQIDELDLDPTLVQTNMVFLTLDKTLPQSLQVFLRQRGILITGRETTRLVTHLDVTTADINTVIRAFQDFFTRNRT